ncbi:hypothetical protein ACJD0Z_08210 [Flavobacteriaceae bacterium M23B6Z8]
MLKKFLIICFLFTAGIDAQQNEIQIIENKTDRKVEFYALNETEKDFDILIKISGSNIKQSMAKPRKIRVPATSKVLLKNIFLVRGKTPSYSYELEVSDSLSRRALRRPFQKVIVVPKRKIPRENITIYIPQACMTCDSIVAGLEKDFYEYKTYVLADNPEVADQLEKAFPSASTPIADRKDAIISIGGKLYTWIDEYQKLLEIMRSDKE